MTVSDVLRLASYARPEHPELYHAVEVMVADYQLMQEALMAATVAQHYWNPSVNAISVLNQLKLKP